MTERIAEGRRGRPYRPWWDEPPPSREELISLLAPLIAQIRRVDAVVARIARGNGCLRDLLALEGILKKPLALRGRGGQEVSLVRPTDLRTALCALSRQLHLEVHTVDERFPCYLLCRISTDWDAPDTVLDELHVSPRNDFFPDRRFVALLRGGRSRTFLRLSIFRERLGRYLRQTGRKPADERACDEVLETAARLVFAAAWYEDQRLPFHVADVFGLTKFRAALELVGFALGSDLYKVATALRDGNGVAIEFFEHVYRNRRLARLLKQLVRGGHHGLGSLEGAARAAFVRLNQVFSDFLSTPGALRDLDRLALYQVVLASFYNLSEVADRSCWTGALRQAVQKAETASAQCARQVLASRLRRQG